jgi:serine protease
MPVLCLVALLLAAAPAAAQQVVPGEVVVKYDQGTTRAQRAAVQAATGTGDPTPIAPQSRVLKVKDGASVAQTVSELRRRPDVQYAAPNVIAHAAGGFFPNDPGKGVAGDWRNMQWNFLGETGINAPDAWANARAAGAPGGRGVTIAVLDTGIAFENRGRFRRSPDFSGTRFTQGRDFVAPDRYPDDQNGHGTFVAGVLAETTDNARGLTGLAYRSTLLPVRVLDARGEGDAGAIEAGIRYAVRRKVQVINLSLEFGTQVRSAEIPGILDALRFAAGRGVLVVAASGNEGERTIAYPARASEVVAVGATTESRCLADYSNGGAELDLVAPGGGPDADVPGDPNCRPFESSDREISQMSFKGGTVRRFGLRGEEGTSMAAPHVSAAAALVIASRVIGARPGAAAVEKRLEDTARDLGSPGFDDRYGAGLLDAAAATRASSPG